MTTYAVPKRKKEILDYSTAYYAFMMGYDVLNKALSESKEPDCDTVFEKCLDYAKRFMNSEEFYDESVTDYEALTDWIYNKGIDWELQGYNHYDVDYSFMVSKTIKVMAKSPDEAREMVHNMITRGDIDEPQYGEDWYVGDGNLEVIE